MNAEQLEQAIAARPAPKVTKTLMEERIKEVVYNRLSDTLTHCMIILDNNYIATGESACVSPANYDKAIGEQLAYNQAFNKLWPLFGFALAEKLHLEKGE